MGEGLPCGVYSVTPQGRGGGEMEVIDSHTHWGPSVTMDIEVTTEELLRQAERSGVSRIVIFPFPSTALSDEKINERLHAGRCYGTQA